MHVVRRALQLDQPGARAAPHHLPRELGRDDAERERLLGLAATMFRAYGGYVERTSRRIPVLRLTPA